MVQFDPYTQAIVAYMTWTRHGEDVRQLFDRAGVRVPSPLLHVIESAKAEAQEPAGLKASRPRAQAPGRKATRRSPPLPSRTREALGEAPRGGDMEAPPGAGRDWIRVAVTDAGPSLLTLALLRQHGPMNTEEVIVRVRVLNPSVSRGSIANVGWKHSGTLITRDASGWRLEKPEAAPVLVDQYLWGPHSIFTKTEQASYRRQRILAALEGEERGLTANEIHKRLVREQGGKDAFYFDWVRGDLKFLSVQGRLTFGAGKRWRLAEA
jgi:hypothetical protein